MNHVYYRVLLTISLIIDMHKLNEEAQIFQNLFVCVYHLYIRKMTNKKEGN